MAEHTGSANERIDMGHRLFLTGFFLPLALGAALATVGFGMTRSSWVALLGLANVIGLVLAANFLYTGKKGGAKIIMAIAGVCLIASIGVFAAGQGCPIAGHVSVQLFLPAIFAGFLAAPSVTVYLASRRGEIIAEPEHEDGPPELLLTPTADGKGASLRDEARIPAATFTKVLLGVCGLLTLCGIGGIALAVLSLMNTGTGVMLILASLTALPAIPIVKLLSEHFGFLLSSKGREKAHLENIVDETGTIFNVVSVSAFVLVVLVVIDLMVR
ncbi:MAG: hypothetical protein EXS16_09180 [Gemmataceae bacterium]|nr:hypothetical protein [Gemmataceae bacterium]